MYFISYFTDGVSAFDNKHRYFLSYEESVNINSQLESNDQLWIYGRIYYNFFKDLSPADIISVLPILNLC